MDGSGQNGGSAMQGVEQIQAARHGGFTPRVVPSLGTRLQHFRKSNNLPNSEGQKKSGGCIRRPSARAPWARGFAIEPLIGSRSSSGRRNMLSSSRENLLPVHIGAIRAPRVLAEAAFPVRASQGGRASVGPSRFGDEIGQQALRAPRNPGLLFAPIGARAGSAGAVRPLLEHPAGEQSQRRLLHHLFQENGQLPAKICHMLQFRHLEISQRRARTLPEIVLRRSPKPSHGCAPDAEAAISASARLASVTDFHISTSTFWPVEIPGRLGGWDRIYLSLVTGSVNTSHVQCLQW